jgi:hypothetical protein
MMTAPSSLDVWLAGEAANWQRKADCWWCVGRVKGYALDKAGEYAQRAQEAKLMREKMMAMRSAAVSNASVSLKEREKWAEPGEVVPVKHGSFW